MEWSYEMMWGKVEILPTLARKGPTEKVTYEARSKGGERIDRVGKTAFQGEKIASAIAQRRKQTWGGQRSEKRPEGSGGKTWHATRGHKVREPVGQTMEGLECVTKDLGFYSELEGKRRVTKCQAWHEMLATVHLVEILAPASPATWLQEKMANMLDGCRDKVFKASFRGND